MALDPRVLDRLLVGLIDRLERQVLVDLKTQLHHLLELPLPVAKTHPDR